MILQLVRFATAAGELELSDLQKYSGFVSTMQTASEWCTYDEDMQHECDGSSADLQTDQTTSCSMLDTSSAILTLESGPAKSGDSDTVSRAPPRRGFLMLHVTHLMQTRDAMVGWRWS